MADPCNYLIPEALINDINVVTVVNFSCNIPLQVVILGTNRDLRSILEGLLDVFWIRSTCNEDACAGLCSEIIQSFQERFSMASQIAFV